MKKTLFCRFLVVLLSLVIIVTPVTAFASQPPDGAQVTDMYSSWAGFDVFMASSVYGFGNEGTYSNFRGGLTTEKFTPVYESLAAELEPSATLDLAPGALVTRGQTVAALYVLLADEAATEDEAAVYFVDAGLMRGRAQGDYQLDAVCTVEEMIVLSVRVYEYAARLAGKDSKGLFWEVQGENNTVYLLGSIHFGVRELYPFSEAIMSAFDNSANLVVELNSALISEDDLAAIQALQLLDFENGETIADYLTEETFELYRTLVEICELPEQFYYIKPWAAMITFEAIFGTGGEDGEGGLIGMEAFLLNRALSMNMNILELEGVIFQLEMLDSYSRELQERLLLGQVTGILGEAGGSAQADDIDSEELQAGYYKLITAIRAGDDDYFDDLFARTRSIDVDDPLAVEYDTAMWANRNIGMAEGIAAFLDSDTDDGNYFVLVGAGHYFGDDSIIALLIEMGYDVVRVR